MLTVYYIIEDDLHAAWTASILEELLYTDTPIFLYLIVNTFLLNCWDTLSAVSSYSLTSTWEAGHFVSN